MLYKIFALLLVSSQFLSMGCAKASDLPDFTQLVEEQGKSVVNVSIVQKSTKENENDREELREELDDTPFQEFFRRFFEERGFEGKPPFSQERNSLGSGVIISTEGLVVTNAHVVNQATEILVKLTDHREFKATLLGKDEESDVALLQIKAGNLPAATLGNSEQLKVGEWVLAIGSPFGFEQSVTAGIVSAKGRSLFSERYVPFIQTDVAINPGNSGGPLFNLKGEVIGINSQILSRTGGYMGVSFAIPIDVVKDIVEQLKKGEKISRGWLGVAFQEMSRELAQSFGLQGTRGALVANVVEKSPAERAKLQPGDVILSYDGHSVENASDLPHLVGRTKIGKEIPLEIWRQNKTIQVSVNIAALPEEYTGKRSLTSKLHKTSNILNVEVRNLTQTERPLRELPEDTNGVLVAWVGKGPALKAGVIVGDIILALNQQEIKNADDFNRVVSQLPPEKTAALLLSRKGQGSRYLAVQVPGKSG